MQVLTNTDVAAKVRGAAAEKRATQKSLASVLSVSAMAMSRRFSGETPFEPVELIKIADALSVPVATFFGEVAVIARQ